MPSPFPGMDPFIEGQKWEDFHARLITVLGDSLMPGIRPRYTVEVERRVYLEQPDPRATESTFVADVAIFPAASSAATDSDGPAVATASTISPKTCTVPYPEEHREPFLTVRRGSDGVVITVIELLSPTNKRPGTKGREVYLSKRLDLTRTAANLVELDLLRGGARPPISDPPPGDYFAMVSHARRRPAVQVYGWSMSQRLPVIPIPLAGDDPDVPLDLQHAFDLVYDRSGYDYSIDYKRPVAPEIDADRANWVQTQLPSE